MGGVSRHVFGCKPAEIDTVIWIDADGMQMIKLVIVHGSFMGETDNLAATMDALNPFRCCGYATARNRTALLAEQIA